MANLYIELPVAAATGDGTTTDVSMLGADKTIVITGLTGGALHIEESDDGTNWAPIQSVTGPGTLFVTCSAANMRTRSSAITGSVTVDVGGEANQVTDVDLNIPVAAGVGTATNTSQYGVEKTITCAGSFTDTVTVEGSNDNTNYAAIASFTGPGEVNIVGAFSRMRVRRGGTVSGTPVVSVGATVGGGAVIPAMVNPVDAAGMGVPIVVEVTVPAAAAGTADDVTIYNGDFPFAARILDCVFVCTTLINPSTVTLRTAAGGAGTALSDAFNTATAGYKRDTSQATCPLLAADDSLFLRRSDRGVAGVLIITLAKV